MGIYETMMRSEAFDGKLTTRRFAAIIGADKNTAHKLLRRIDRAMARDFNLFFQITDCMRSWEDEGYF